ncbi:hypothetical protein AN958_09060 [Leucoagaricus sp. SymC.cos]|nr:hypothetical protein AN958_09060 [Leucoagaricus sp. SymC.cos]
MFFAILLLVLALVPPLFSRSVMRRKTWHTLILSLLVFSIGEVLLVGHQDKGASGMNLCLVQVAIVYSTPPLIALATAAYSADIYISIRSMFGSDDWAEDGPEPQTVVILVLAPWIVFCLVFLETILVVGLHARGAFADIQESGLFFCHVEGDLLAVIISAVIVITACLSAVALQAATGWTLYKNWLSVQKVSIAATARKYIHAFIRTIAFTGVAIIAVILGFVALVTFGQTHIGFSMLMPIFPIVAALIFGTYRDIVLFYVFWR